MICAERHTQMQNSLLWRKAIIHGSGVPVRCSSAQMIPNIARKTKARNEQKMPAFTRNVV